MYFVNRFPDPTIICASHHTTCTVTLKPHRTAVDGEMRVGFVCPRNMPWMDSGEQKTEDDIVAPPSLRLEMQKHHDRRGRLKSLAEVLCAAVIVMRISSYRSPCQYTNSMKVRDWVFIRSLF